MLLGDTNLTKLVPFKNIDICPILMKFCNKFQYLSAENKKSNIGIMLIFRSFRYALV